MYLCEIEPVKLVKNRSRRLLPKPPRSILCMDTMPSMQRKPVRPRTPSNTGYYAQYAQIASTPPYAPCTPSNTGYWRGQELMSQSRMSRSRTSRSERRGARTSHVRTSPFRTSHRPERRIDPNVAGLNVASTRIPQSRTP